MPVLRKRWESENRENFFLRLSKNVHNNKSNSCWRSLYIVDPEPIGRGFAGKVYKIQAKANNSCCFRESPFDENTATCAGGDFAATYYACKAIRRWRCGKDTMNKIRRELKALYKLQTSRDQNMLLLRCQDSASLSELKCDLGNSPLLPCPPKSSCPRLIAFHEGEMEVAIVMEFANGGSLYDLCKTFYEPSRLPFRPSGRRQFEALSRKQSFCPNCNGGSECLPCGDTQPSSANVSCRTSIESTSIPESYVTHVVRELISAVLYMHKHLKMVHLDIKAENVLLREPYPSTDVFLTDFGLATELSEDKQHRELAGTPDYAAPEIINYDPISFATDMWSLGVLTYFLLTGVSPFLAEEKEITMQNVTHGPINFPDELFATRSPEALSFVQGLLIRKPSARLTAEQCLQHPWLCNRHDSAIDLVSCSPCSDANTFASFSDEVNLFADSEPSDHELKTSQKEVDQSEIRNGVQSAIVPRAEPVIHSSDETTSRSPWHRGYFGDFFVHARGSTKSAVIRSAREISSFSLHLALLWAKEIRNLNHLDNLNPVLLHLSRLSLHRIDQRESTRQKIAEIPGHTSISDTPASITGEQSTSRTVSGGAAPKRRNPSLTSSTERRPRYCVEMHMKFHMPTTQQLSLATENACSTLIYIPGSNSSVLGRNSYSFFRGLENGSQSIRNNLSLLHRNHMSASLDCLCLVPLKSSLLLSPSRTPLDSSQSHESKLTRSQLCWQGTEVHEPINNDSLYSNSHHPLAQTGSQEWRPPRKPNVTFSRLARSIRETLTRAARFITSPSVWSAFSLHRPSNTRT